MDLTLLRRVPSPRGYTGVFGVNGIEVFIAGCGFTGRRVARLFLERGAAVTVTSREVSKLADLDELGARVVRFDLNSPGLLPITKGALLLHSLPVIDDHDPTPELLRAFAAEPSRVIYLSTTGVYGDAAHVDATTAVAPSSRRTRLRLDAERLVSDGPWSSMVLRPAAIYGPGRGVHAALREGRVRVHDGGSNVISRIHVDDLTAHACAALLSDVAGAWPVADEYPCPSLEVARYAAEILGIDLSLLSVADDAPETMRSNRRVDGRAVRRLLGVTLRYPTYREGVRASIEAERRA